MELLIKLRKILYRGVLRNMIKSIKSIIILFIIVFFSFFIGYNVFASELSLTKGHYNTFKGEIANKYSVKMYLYCDKENKLEGNYFYIKYKNKIKLKGDLKENKITLFEYNKKGYKTAKFVGKIKEKNFAGTWYNLENNKQYDFKLKLVGHFWGTAGSIYADAGLNNEEEVENFAKDLKHNILNKNKKKVAEKIDYPIEVKIQGENKVIKNKEKFIEEFDKIFYKEYVEKLKNTPTINLNTHYMWGVMLGSKGEIWFDKPWREKELKVRAINN
jgi:hypothetical protein